MAYARPIFKDNDGLINYLVKEKTISTAAVIAAMKKVDRKDFVPNKASSQAYEDRPQYLGYGATISAPHMHGHALEQLSTCLKPGMKALDVGSGSGIIVAYMCHMVTASSSDNNNNNNNNSNNNNNNNENDSKNDKNNDKKNDKNDANDNKNGQIIGIEHMGELVSYSIKNLHKNKLHKEWLDNGTLIILEGDGRKGYLKEAPFDCIHVGAAAPENCVQTLFDQLKDYGLMAIPVELNKTKEQVFRLYIKNPKKMKNINGKNVILANDCYKDLLGVRYVPLTSKEKQAQNA